MLFSKLSNGFDVLLLDIVLAGSEKGSGHGRKIAGWAAQIGSVKFRLKTDFSMTFLFLFHLVDIGFRKGTLFLRP